MATVRNNRSIHATAWSVGGPPEVNPMGGHEG